MKKDENKDMRTTVVQEQEQEMEHEEDQEQELLAASTRHYSTRRLYPAAAHSNSATLPGGCPLELSWPPHYYE